MNDKKIEMWQKRRCSWLTVFFAMLAVLVGAIWMFQTLPTFENVSVIQPLRQQQVNYALFALVLIACAVAFELFDELRIPPARWRIKAELTQLMIDEKFLPFTASKVMIDRDLSIKKMNWSRQAKTMTVDFFVSPSPSLAKLRRLNAQVFRFKRAKQVTFDEVRDGDVFICYRMILFYADTSKAEVKSPWQNI